MPTLNNTALEIYLNALTEQRKQYLKIKPTTYFGTPSKKTEDILYIKDIKSNQMVDINSMDFISIELVNERICKVVITKHVIKYYKYEKATK